MLSRYIPYGLKRRPTYIFPIPKTNECRSKALTFSGAIVGDEAEAVSQVAGRLGARP